MKFHLQDDAPSTLMTIKKPNAVTATEYIEQLITMHAKATHAKPLTLRAEDGQVIRHWTTKDVKTLIAAREEIPHPLAQADKGEMNYFLVGVSMRPPHDVFQKRMVCTPDDHAIRTTLHNGVTYTETHDESTFSNTTLLDDRGRLVKHWNPIQLRDDVRAFKAEDVLR